MEDSGSTYSTKPFESVNIFTALSPGSGSPSPAPSNEGSPLPRSSSNGDLVSTVSKRRQSPEVKLVRCLTSSIPKSMSFHRASVIPYCRIKGVTYFIMTVDARYGELTDNGGSVEPQEDWLTTGLRELSEETMQIFDYTDDKSQEFVRNNSIAMYLDTSIIIFQQVEVASLSDLYNEFRWRYLAARQSGANQSHIENSHLMWISEMDLMSVVYGGRYAQVKLPPDLANLFCENKSRTGVYPPLYSRVRAILTSAFKYGSSLI